MDEKNELAVKNVEFNKGRFRTYYGNIAELIVEEVLGQNGFDVWLFRPFSIEPLDLRFALSSLYHRDYEKMDEPERVRFLKSFFEDKLQSFEKYVAETNIMVKDGQLTGTSKRRRYKPDLLAKKGSKIYVVEVKANSGKQNLKGEKLDGLLEAKKYGFIPMLVTINVAIRASNLVTQLL
jgi:hypothetical protein